MTGDEFSELASLWSDSTAPADRSELERLARRTPRVARLAQWSELVVVAILVVTIISSIIWRLGPSTLLLGGLVLLLLGWSAWKRHKLANIALLVEEGDHLSFVESTLKAKEAQLNHSAIGLALILPGTLLTMLLGYALKPEAGESGFGSFLITAVSAPRGLAALACLACAVVLLALSHLKLMRELNRLRQLRQEYVREAERDQPGSS